MPPTVRASLCLLWVPLLATACGEPAYYPALAEAVDTGWDPVAQLCGAAGVPIAQTVEVRSLSEQPLRVVAVDAACMETPLGTLQPREVRAFVVDDLDALGAYVDTLEGEVRIAVREPSPGLDASGWAIP